MLDVEEKLDFHKTKYLELICWNVKPFRVLKSAKLEFSLGLINNDNKNIAVLGVSMCAH